MKKVYVEITNSCNLDCEFCHNTNRIKENMEIERFDYIVNQIKDYTNLVCLHVKGEPLFYPNLDKIFEILEKYNLKTNITTNGTLLKFRAGILKKFNCIRQINISLHSSIENSKIDVKTYMRRIFEVVDDLEKSGIIISYRLWNLENYHNNNKNIEIINCLETKYKLNNLKFQLKENEWIKIKENVFINQDFEFIWPNLNQEIINENGRCLALKEQFGILVNGDVVPCCIDSEGEIKLGNIFEEDIKYILESNKSKEIINNFKKNNICEDLCKRCGFLKRLEEKRRKNDQRNKTKDN